MTSNAATMTRGRMRPSDSELNARANAEKASPYREQNWESKQDRPHRPPHDVNALVGWFEGEVWASVPERMHERGVWHSTTQRVTVSKAGVVHLLADCSDAPEPCGHVVEGEPLHLPPDKEPTGGSALGAPAYSGPVRMLLERIMDAPHSRDRDGDLIDPFRSATASLVGHQPDLLRALVLSGFDRSALDGARIRCTQHGEGCLFVAPKDVIEREIRDALTSLWWRLSERVPRESG